MKKINKLFLNVLSNVKYVTFYCSYLYTEYIFGLIKALCKVIAQTLCIWRDTCHISEMDYNKGTFVLTKILFIIEEFVYSC